MFLDSNLDLDGLWFPRGANDYLGIAGRPGLGPVSDTDFDGANGAIVERRGQVESLIDSPAATVPIAEVDAGAAAYLAERTGRRRVIPSPHVEDLRRWRHNAYSKPGPPAGCHSKASTIEQRPYRPLGIDDYLALFLMERVVRLECQRKRAKALA